MTVTILLFAVARQKVGAPELTLELPEPATVLDLRLAIAREHPSLAPLLPSMMVAVENAYVGDDAPIAPSSEIALIPPVSGGAR